MDIKLKTATIANVEEVLALHYRYQLDSIAEEDKEDGFITTAFTKEHLTRLIEDENGLFIASIDNKIVAYAMAASWQFWSQWAMFQFMIAHLDDATYQDQPLTINNSYQYGPVCVDKQVRGTGVFEHVFNFTLRQMSNRYPIMVTFINKVNSRSFAAHTGKTPLQVINKFEFNNHHYFKLACATSRQTSTRYVMRKLLDRIQQIKSNYTTRQQLALLIELQLKDLGITSEEAKLEASKANIMQMIKEFISAFKNNNDFK